MLIVRARYCRLAALLFGLLVLTACSEETAELAAGQEPYLRYCSTCHGISGEGRPPTFPPLAGSEWLDLGPEATALIVLVGLRGEIEVAGQTYRGYMPPLRHISDQDIAASIGYIDDQWADWPEPLTAARVAALREQLGNRQPIQGLEGLQALLEEIQP